MKPTTLLTKSNKTHSMVTLYSSKKKKVKMFLSSLFNNYLHINTTQMTNENSKQIMTTTIMKKSKLESMSMRTLLWLGKEYDTNSLYPWTQQQQKMMNPLLHIQKMMKSPKKTLSFHTMSNKNSEWTLNHTQKKHFFHYKMSFFTKQNKNNTKLQLNLKHMSNNTNMKNTINNLYGKWSMQTMKQNNNMESMSMMEHSKLKLLKTMHMSKKKMDSKNTLQKEEKKHQKGKMGYQKNEFLNSWSLLKDNFKICNIIHNKSNSNSMHLQQHSKLKY